MSNPLFPTVQELTDLYITQHLTDRQIADYLGLPRWRIGRLRKTYGIKGRRPVDSRFPDRIRPTKDELYSLYSEQYLSYQEIADIFSVDATTVPYWLRKHGIPSHRIWETRLNGSRLSEPSLQQLRDLYLDKRLSTSTISEMFSVSPNTILRRLDRYGIPKRPSGYTGIRFVCQDGHIVKSGLELLVDDWLSAQNILHLYEPSLPFKGRSDFLVGAVYIEIWGMKHSPRYEQRRLKKSRLYKEHDLDLIHIFPIDIPNRLEQKLGSLLELDDSGDSAID